MNAPMNEGTRATRGYRRVKVQGPLEQRFDVGGEGWEAVDKVADRTGGYAVLHRQPKDVDQLLTGVPEEVRADDSIGLFVDQHL